MASTIDPSKLFRYFIYDGTNLETSTVFPSKKVAWDNLVDYFIDSFSKRTNLFLPKEYFEKGNIISQEMEYWEDINFSCDCYGGCCGCNEIPKNMKRCYTVEANNRIINRKYLARDVCYMSNFTIKITDTSINFTWISQINSWYNITHEIVYCIDSFDDTKKTFEKYSGYLKYLAIDSSDALSDELSESKSMQKSMPKSKIYNLMKIDVIDKKKTTVTLESSGTLHSIRDTFYILLKKYLCTDIDEIKEYLKDRYDIIKDDTGVFGKNVIYAYNGFNHYRFKALPDRPEYHDSKITFKNNLDDYRLIIESSSRCITYQIVEDELISNMYSQNKILKEMKREKYYSPEGEGFQKALKSFTKSHETKN